jgi:methylenetetrahydrofolate dehydrogenase (NADP+)/methenyltetrahydrofolate cyclohydrolase
MADAKIVDGKKISQKLRDSIAKKVPELKKEKAITPGLAVVLVGENPASQVYVRTKSKKAKEVGIDTFDHYLPHTTSQEELLSLIDKLNKDSRVNGILVQLPLPDRIDSRKVIDSVAIEKDVDGFHVENAGNLSIGGSLMKKALVPCTPLGCFIMLKETIQDIQGKNAVVLGRSNIVGKPMAQLLLSESCTVTIAHSKTQNLPDVCRQADILVAAVGRPEMVKGSWIKPGSTVIDVGINRVEDNSDKKYKLVGDVNFDEAFKIASAITPVPGGVGPMTIACLLRNTLVAACRQHGIADLL